MARAYLLALFSHFVTKLLADLHVGLHGPEALVSLFEPKPEPEAQENGHEENGEESNKSNEEQSETNNKKKKKKRVNRLDRFKRRRPGDESESSGSDMDSYDEQDGEFKFVRSVCMISFNPIIFSRI